MPGTWRYELIDITGRQVEAGVLAGNGGVAQFTLPSAITPGIFYIRLYDNGNQYCIKSIEIAQ